MTDKKKSKVDGAASPAETAPPQVMPSSSEAAPQNTSDMLATTAPQSPTFQPGKNFQQVSEVDTATQMLTAMADRLVGDGLAEWRRISLGDGRRGYALFFPVARWERDEKTSTLKLRG